MTQKEIGNISSALGKIERYIRNIILPKLRALKYGAECLSTDWVRREPYLPAEYNETARKLETSFWFGISVDGEIKLCQEDFPEGFELLCDDSRPLYGENSVRLAAHMPQALELIKSWPYIIQKLHDHYARLRGSESRIDAFNPQNGLKFEAKPLPEKNRPWHVATEIFGEFEDKYWDKEPEYD